MTQRVEVNDEGKACRAGQSDYGKPKPQGKALQVNENSVEDREPAGSPRRRVRRRAAPAKSEGKSLQVNENSVTDQASSRPPLPLR
jgi:hypothetical protein